FTPTAGGNSLVFFLYHGGSTGADSHILLVNQCIAPPTTGVLTVMKNVSGGAAVASNFSLHVKSGSSDVTGSPFSGSTGGKDFILSTGSYSVTEDAFSGYSLT